MNLFQIILEQNSIAHFTRRSERIQMECCLNFKRNTIRIPKFLNLNLNLKVLSTLRNRDFQSFSFLQQNPSLKAVAKN